MAVLMISEDALKEASIINENVDMKVLTPTIVMVQDMYIHPIVGTGIFNELKTQITASSVSTDNKTLLDTYIQPAIIWWIMFEAPIIMTYKFMNKSVMKKNSENSTPPDNEDLIALANKFRDKAEWYSQRATNFLRANSTLYPLYLTVSNANCDYIFPKRNNYTTGMYLDITPTAPLSFKDKYQGDGCGDC